MAAVAAGEVTSISIAEGTLVVGLAPTAVAAVAWEQGGRGAGSGVAGARGTTGKLLGNALQPFKGGSLTQAGRALTKHPEVLGHTKETLRTVFRTDAEINAAAADALGDILRGTQTAVTLPRYGAVIEFRGSSGFGARFYAETGEFIGFINL